MEHDTNERAVQTNGISAEPRVSKSLFKRVQEFDFDSDDLQKRNKTRLMILVVVKKMRFQSISRDMIEGAAAGAKPG